MSRSSAEEILHSVFFLFFLLTVTCAKSIYVAPNGRDLGNGSISAPFTTITQAVSSAQSGDEILLMAGTFNESSPVSVVAMSLSFSTASGLDDVTILATEVNAAIFNISNHSDVSMQNLAINGAGGLNRSCISVESWSRLSLQAVYISDCNSSFAYEGGAIHVNASAPLRAVDCSFEGNSAQKGGAIANDGAASLVNCTFMRNCAQAPDFVSADFGSIAVGGAISNRGSINVTHCSFVNNSAVNSAWGTLNSAHGGALYSFAGNVSVEDSLFIDNIAQSISISTGGAIFTHLTDTIVKQCLFTRNAALSHYNSAGGALDVAGSTSHATLIGCVFESNTAHAQDQIRSVYAFGGAVDSTISVLLITDCIFTNNSVFADAFLSFASGGAVDLYSFTTIYNSTFSSNTITTFSRSNSFAEGGAISAGSRANVSNCVFFLNSINISGNISLSGYKPTSARGGAYSAVYANSFLKDCLFIRNSVSSSDSFNLSRAVGGAYQSEMSSDSLTNCTFIENTATAPSFGGALFKEIDYFQYSTSLSSCRFTNNLATNGGAVYSASGSTSIINSTFEYNWATQQWASVFVANGSGVACTFLCNHADVNGNTVGFPCQGCHTLPCNVPYTTHTINSTGVASTSTAMTASSMGSTASSTATTASSTRPTSSSTKTTASSEHSSLKALWALMAIPVIIILAMIIWWWYSRRQTRQQQQTMYTPMTTEGEEAPQSEGEDTETGH